MVAEEVETTTRWKQIRLGEWTQEYSVWLYSSDKDKKLFPFKQPPDSSAAMPKRVFLRELSAWRRSLHEFQEWLGGDDHERRHDPLAPRGTVASSSSYRGRTSYPAAKRPRTSSWSETEGGHFGQSWDSDWQGRSSDWQSWDWQISDSASWASRWW